MLEQFRSVPRPLRRTLLADLVRPTIVVILVGGNDLCQQDAHPWWVSDNLLSFADSVANLKKVAAVVIAGQFARARGWIECQ